jgi:hypothetical protein
MAQNQSQNQSGQQGDQDSRRGRHQGDHEGGRVVSRVVVAVGIPNSKIRTQTVVGVFGIASKTILGTINDSLFARRRLRLVGRD